MVIGIVCQNFPPAAFEGGISHYSLHLGKALIAQGHHVVAITSSEFAKADTEAATLAGLQRRCVKGPWNHRTIREIHRIASADNLDALVLQYSPASFKTSFRLRWAITRFPCQKITAFHTLWGDGFDRAVGLSLLMGSEKVVATNSEIMALLERHAPVFLRKTYWIPIGSNIQPPAQHEAKPESRGCPVFSYFGMLYPGKGLSLILSTLEGLKKRGCVFQFKFVGGGMLDSEGYESQFRNQIQQRGLAPVAEHLGLLPDRDVSGWLAASRFIFLPYERGLSDRRGSFMAAIAHGKAVLTSPPAVDMPFLKNGINVLWPRRPTPEAYIEAAERMLRDDLLLHRLEAGAEKLARQFQWKRIAEDYLLVFRSRFG